MRRPARTPVVVTALLALSAARCGDSGAGPTPGPTPMAESWFIVPVLCEGCPGLANVEIDRSSAPARAKLLVGQRTSIRAVAKVGCGTEQPGQLEITRWEASDPRIIAVEPSSGESAIVTALAPGRSGVSAERRLPGGASSAARMRDSFRADPPCPVQPELVFEVVP